MTYNEEYYKGGNYTDYLDRRERYWRLSRDIDMFLDMLCLKQSTERVLDYGCGVGFLVEGLKRQGYREVYGYDPSEWAVNYARNHLKILTVTNDLDGMIKPWHLVTALDVLEHVPEEYLLETIRGFASEHVLVRIPVPHKDGEPYIYEVSNRDPTHVTKLSKRTWDDYFYNAEYDLVCRVNLPNMWDSEGVLCALYRLRQF